MIAPKDKSAMYRTGIRRLDQEFGGVRRNELAVVLSASALTPSQVLASLVREAAVPTLIFTTRDGELASMCERDDVYTDNAGHRALATLAERARSARDALGIELVVVENLRHINGARYYDVDLPMRHEFARLPKSLGVALAVGWVSEYKRDMPRWSDLRGTIAEDPDLLVFVYREERDIAKNRIATHRQDGGGVTYDELWIPGLA